VNYPIVFFLLCLVGLWISAQTGAFIRRKRRNVEAAEREDLSVILAASLTLLGLIIGFSFSMAVSRYDQRKNFEEEEANAIGTEYLRVGLLPAADAARARKLLTSYLDQRILFYTTDDEKQADQINAATSRLQTELWSAVEAPAALQPTPPIALVVSGMNDVINRQGYSQAAYWNRIPIAAWRMMELIAIFCNVLVGYSAQRADSKAVHFFVLPLLVAISFFLISDLDAPHGGIIRVSPQNLISLANSLRGQ
jgi:hypothetical protein